MYNLVSQVEFFGCPNTRNGKGTIRVIWLLLYCLNEDMEVVDDYHNSR